MNRFLFGGALFLLGDLCIPSSAQAEMVLSQVIVDLGPGRPAREDIEVWNNGSERLYVHAEPFEIIAAGTDIEQRLPASDPETSGILVSPQRLVLAPGERREIRIALVSERPLADRIYRLAVRPVVGAVSADESAVKVLVGYDALVLVRPTEFSGDVVGDRNGATLILRNEGNTSQEIFQGRQCNSAGIQCQDLPAKRLYPGATWIQTLPFDAGRVDYKTAIAHQIRDRQF